jgi:hypothetical protein
VPEAPTIREYRHLRATFIAEAGWESKERAEERFSVRDTALDQAVVSGREIVLWLEHDLYDQLQRLEILSRLRGSSPLEIRSPTFIAETPAGMLAAQWERRGEVGAQALALARAAWEAFRSPQPTRFACLDAEGDPMLAGGIRRWVQTFPDQAAGLSVTERWTLELLKNAPRSFGQLFDATQEMETAKFRGDGSYWRLARRLAGGREPLVDLPGDAPGALPPRAADSIRITEAGLRVLAGQADAVTCCGLDDWRGGAHLTARHHWRRTADAELVLHTL